ncbi:hypothetical protein H109_01656 [Trichophyton interdigitale MR816]|uniref:Uncharacterized protein n=1 Tax=Trichophyton interdigitale (strain MR816) TaxID=1215338 RepID=A0A059JF99_TRIIM|nr:hypothetical protein H109_01656 [Trichophyton interdigitale MR816]
MERIALGATAAIDKTKKRLTFPEARHEVTFERQEDMPAFGSVIYSFVTAEDPYQERTGEEITKLYTAGTFPDNSRWPIGAVTSKCWQGEYSNAAEVLEDIR